MKRMMAAALLLFAAPVYAEQVTVDQVVELSLAGLGDEAIIAKIKSSGARFDLSTDQMLSLKKLGVSGPVLAAMLTSGSTGGTTMSISSPDPMAPHPAGVYLLHGHLPKPEMKRIDPTMSSQAKTGGIIGYAFTAGIASMSVKVAIANDRANTKAFSKQPVFFFFFDESNPSAVQQGAFLAGLVTNASSPSEFSLVQLMKKEGRREARVGSMNIAGAKSGVMDKDRISFQQELVRPGVYRVTPTAPLEAGEYGFIYSFTGGMGAGGAMARIFDFSVL
jgi:hypothetical protein